MSIAMMKMYISFGGMALLIISSVMIVLSRVKLKGVVAGIVAAIAYIFFIVGGLIIVYIVFSGPTR